MSENCVWTRLSDSTNLLHVRRVRFETSCTDEIAIGAHAVYLDDCPNCERPVKIANAVPPKGDLG